MYDVQIEDLHEAYEQNLLILVVGSGVSVPFSLPDWKDLIRAAVDHFDLTGHADEIEDCLKKHEYLDAIDLIIASGITENELQLFVAAYLEEAKQNIDIKTVQSNYPDLAKFIKSRFLTTNYDEFLEDFIPDGRVFSLSDLLGSGNVNQFSRAKFNRTIIPLHGTIHNPKMIVFSRKSYQELYETSAFETEFEFLRTTYTFLFVGFSFDDNYFRRLFKKMLRRLDAEHYILFSEKMKKDKDEVEKTKKLKTDYNVTTIYYNGKDHVKGIKEILNRIINFSDNDIDTRYFKTLPQIPDIRGKYSEIDKAEKAFSDRKIGQALKIYQRIFADPDHYMLSDEEWGFLYSHIIYCYGTLRNYGEAAKYTEEMYKMLKKENTPRYLCFSIAELCISRAEWDEALSYLKDEKDGFGKVLRVSMMLLRKYLSDDDITDNVLIISDHTPWSEEEAAQREQDYQTYKKHFIYEKTYNLKNLKQYKYGNAQEAAYYWIAFIAQSIFCQYKDAVEYLYRGYEIDKSPRFLEELAINYLRIGEKDISGKSFATSDNLDKDALMKAKNCFERIFSVKDSVYKASILKSHGPSYLRVLYLLGDDLHFLQWYPKILKYCKTSRMYQMRATVGARFSHRLYTPAKKHISEPEYILVSASVWYEKSALHFRKENYEKSTECAKKAIQLIVNYPEFEKNQNMVVLLSDVLFILRQKKAYDQILSIYTKNFGEPLPSMKAFGAELDGNLITAEDILKAWFEQKPDMAVFISLRDYYKRYDRNDKLQELYQLTEISYPEIIYNREEFYGSWIRTCIDEGDMEKAFHLYGKHCLEFSDPDNLMELEDSLYDYIGDYAYYEDRIDWLKKAQSLAPPEACDYYLQKIFLLYLFNNKMESASEVLGMMATAQSPDYESLKNIYKIMILPQSEEYYAYGAAGNMNQRYMEAKMAEIGSLPGWEDMFISKREKEIIMPVYALAFLFINHRADILDLYSKVLIPWCGYSVLKISLMYREDLLTRQVLSYIENAENIKLITASLSTICYVMDEMTDERSFETIQIMAYLKDNGGDTLFC